MINNITNDIVYIGVDDNDLDLFEGQYIIPNGIAYNSYLIKDEKVVVMDTVDSRKMEPWMANLREALGESTPDYLVVQHLEPDHAGCIGHMMELYPQLRVVTSARAVAMLPHFFEQIDFAGRTIAVKEGDSLNIGERTLQFVMAPMVHWPEVLVTYSPQDKVLFSADAFGKFGALSHEEEWACEARRYYFNICGKYGAPVQTLLGKVATLDVECICPLHGPILKEKLSYYIGLYDTWSRYEAESKGVFIACASIYGNTLAAANHLADMLRERGVEKVSVADLARDDMAEALEDAFRYDRLVVAAASYDADVFPPMHDFLHHLKLKNYQNRRVGIIENGSWAPTAARVMRAMLEQMKGVEIVDPVVTIQSTLKQSNIPTMEALADALVK